MFSQHRQIGYICIQNVILFLSKPLVANPEFLIKSFHRRNYRRLVEHVALYGIPSSFFMCFFQTIHKQLKIFYRKRKKHLALVSSCKDPFASSGMDQGRFS